MLGDLAKRLFGSRNDRLIKSLRPKVDAINAKEAEHIRGVWDELKRFTEGFVRLCEKGDFTHLADEIKTHQGHK